MTTIEFMRLRERVAILSELVTLDISMQNLDLDTLYEHTEIMLSLIGEMRIVDAMLERQATADALAVPEGGKQ
jgi:hypothetical protein